MGRNLSYEAIGNAMVDSADDAAAENPPPAVAVSESFQILLGRLAGSGAGALGYERLRMRLVAFFRLHFPAQAEDLADQALDRLARRLADGTSVDSPESYALGIARLLVLEEHSRQRKEQRVAIEAAREVELSRRDAEPDPAVPALRLCLESLDLETATFILDYYTADGGANRIERRQRLAEMSGVTLNALRNRALRIRMALEKCVRQRLQQEPSDSTSTHDRTPNSNTKSILEGDTRQ